MGHRRLAGGAYYRVPGTRCAGPDPGHCVAGVGRRLVGLSALVLRGGLGFQRVRLAPPGHAQVGAPQRRAVREVQLFVHFCCVCKVRTRRSVSERYVKEGRPRKHTVPGKPGQVKLELQE